MNNLTRDTLRRITAKYGREIGSDARRCAGLLNDLDGAHRREINVLVTAIEERVPDDLLAAHRAMPLELLLTRIEKRLEEQTALTAEAARWAVESWALALNVATDDDLASRRRQTPAAPPAAETVPPPKKSSAAPNAFPPPDRAEPVQPPTSPPRVNSPPRINPPPIVRQPSGKPPAPPISVPANNPSAAPPRANPSIAVKKGFGWFRGCLIVIFLLFVSGAVLFLGVPYAIEVMRETQRERDSEPPRFPVR